jgi:hypothetical protein
LRLVFGLGAAVKALLGIRENRRRIAALEEISLKSRADNENLLFRNTVGLARFEQRMDFLDATLEARLNARQPWQSASELVEKYLQKILEEFEMSKSLLRDLPASRAQVEALGIAVRELALSADHTYEDLRGRTDDYLQRAMEEGLAVLSDELGRALRVEAALRHSALSDLVRDEIARVENSTTNQLKTMRSSLDAVRLDQQNFSATLQRRLTRITRWSAVIFISTIVSILAVIYHS